MKGSIENIYKLGKKVYKRPIVVELSINKRIRKNILHNNRIFSGTGIAINEYLNGELMEKRKESGKILQEAK